MGASGFVAAGWLAAAAGAAAVSGVPDCAAAANGQFSSGWAWLVDKDGKLQDVATANADTPMAHGVRCLLTLDVWEHAYYVDYRNQRKRYVQAVLEKRLNWEFGEKNLSSGT